MLLHNKISFLSTNFSTRKGFLRNQNWVEKYPYQYRAFSIWAEEESNYLLELNSLNYSPKQIAYMLKRSEHAVEVQIGKLLRY